MPTTTKIHSSRISVCESFAPEMLSSGFPVRMVRIIFGCPVLFFLTLLLSTQLFAAPADPETKDDEEARQEETAERTDQEKARQTLKERVNVVGGSDRVFEVPGSAHYIDKDELDRFKYDDVQRILRQVPGVNIQDEEGFGLRPNIGMRGTGVERSQKITLLEDGILIAPAPYAAPAAYYFPTVARMRGVEVRKGSSAIRQGPFTTGGALNMLSREIPSSAFEGGLQMDVGSFEERKGHLHTGGSGDRFGWFMETVQISNDGFKRLDNGASTGFVIEDYLGKFRWNSRPGSATFRSFEVKVGVTDQQSQETYLGLTSDDYAATPYRRYAGSAEDDLDSSHRTVAITWFQQLGATADWTARVYRNDFFRNWHKLDSVAGSKIDNILTDPDSHSSEIAWIRGESASPSDAFLIRNNRRDYVSEGAESIVAFRLGGERHRHAFEIGLRVHRDSEDRFQEDDAWGMGTDGVMSLARLGDPGSQSNRIQSADATALYLEDRWSFGGWTITPGLRLEDIRYSRVDYGTADPDRLGADLAERRNSVRQWVPGLALAREFSPSWSAFTSVHRGFAPPGPGASEDADAEISWNYEAGARFHGTRVAGEITAFFNDYQNLLGRDTLSGGGSGTGELFNAGAVEIYGLETGLSRSFQHGSFEFPTRATYTYTRGTFQNGFDTKFSDWSPRVEAGDELPYAPQHQASVEVGVRRGAWQAFMNLSAVSEMRTKSGSGAIPTGESIEGHRILDLALGYSVSSVVRVTMDVRNLTDEVYLAALRPSGLRPGLPRSVRFGVEVNF